MIIRRLALIDIPTPDGFELEVGIDVGFDECLEQSRRGIDQVGSEGQIVRSGTWQLMLVMGSYGCGAEKSSIGVCE